MSESKVIFHVDKVDNWKSTLKDTNLLLNSKNIEKYYIEVLATSEAVKCYNSDEVLDSDINTMKKLINKGVKFAACNHSLTKYNVKSDKIISFVDIVPTGPLELATKQSNGYIYLQAW